MSMQQFRCNIRELSLLLLLSGCAVPVVIDSYTSDEIAKPLTREQGDLSRGREIVLNPEAHCLLCHAVPGVRFTGNLGPSLAGVGKRLTPGQLRLRIVDSTRIDPDSIMPPYYRNEKLYQVSAAYRGKTILSAQQVEDVVAFLASLQE